MNRGKKPDRSLNHRMYLDLKDIIRESTLPFVPAKSLFRFNTVCRDWKLQISSPFFAHNQSLACRRASGLFLQTPGGSPSLMPIDAHACGVPDPLLRFLPEAVDIRSSSNGLLCCQGRAGDKAYYICNPVTQKWKKLAKSTANHGSDPAIVLIFEPSLLNFVAEYKVICAFPSPDFDDAIEFDIYSSKGDSWEISGEICYGTRTVVPQSGVYVSGVAYWTTTTAGILAFDLTKERSLHFHGYYHSGYNYSSYNHSINNRKNLGSFNGKLCKPYVNGGRITLSVLNNVHTNTMTMQMGSQTRMWDDKKSIPFDSTTVRSVLHVDSDVMVVQSSQGTYSYDFKSGAKEVLSSSADFDNMRCFPYVNSLVAL